MQRVLRSLRLNNEPLPENVKELQQLYLMNAASRNNKKFKYHQYKHVLMQSIRYNSQNSAQLAVENSTHQKAARSSILPLIIVRNYHTSSLNLTSFPSSVIVFVLSASPACFTDYLCFLE